MGIILDPTKGFKRLGWVRKHKGYSEGTPEKNRCGAVSGETYRSKPHGVTNDRHRRGGGLLVTDLLKLCDDPVTVVETSAASATCTCLVRGLRVCAQSLVL